MKLLSALTVSVLFSLGSLAAVAQTGGMGGDRQSSFSVVDENADGTVDREEARSAGIDDQSFDDMDQNGDGVISEQEYSSSDKEGQRGSYDKDETGDDESEDDGWQ